MNLPRKLWLFSAGNEATVRVIWLAICAAQYPASFRPIRVVCTARVSSDLILQTFAKGADGILIGG